MCLSPVRVKLYAGTLQERFIQVPCGKCLECLKDKQNDYMQVFYRAAHKYGKMVFVTLTYNDATMPIRVRNLYIDRDTGAIGPAESMPVIPSHLDGYNLRWSNPMDLEYVKEVFPLSANRIRESFKNQKCAPKTLDGIYSMYIEACPSLRRKDVRLWLKRSRINYERTHGERLPDFKYVCVGEHGSKSFRPHYHLCFFGLDVKIVKEMCLDWSEKYGFSYVKNVPLVSNDGHNDVEACGHYVAKYMTKGCFDAYFVKDGLVEPPRIMISTQMVDVSDVIDYYRGRDFMPDDMPNMWYDVEQMARLANRQLFKVNGKEYKLGIHLKRAIFYEKVKKEKLDGSTSVTYKGDSLQIALADFTRSCHSQRVMRELQEVQDELADQDWSEVIAEYEMRSANQKANRKAFLFTRLKQFYQKDRF